MKFEQGIPVGKKLTSTTDTVTRYVCKILCLVLNFLFFKKLVLARNRYVKIKIKIDNLLLLLHEWPLIMFFNNVISIQFENKNYVCYLRINVCTKF